MTLERFVRGVQRRIVCDTRWLIVAADPLAIAPLVPDGYTLVRVSRDDRRHLARAQEAMRRSGSAEDAATRVDAGDEFFGWEADDAIVSFGWMAYRPRVLAARRAAAAPRRAFIYHFHTLSIARGRNLYASLLMQTRYAAGLKSQTEIVADVQVSNIGSRRGLEKAGFTPIASATVRTFFTRFEREQHRALVGQRRTPPVW